MESTGEAERTRLKILRAAEECFAETGFGATSTSYAETQALKDISAELPAGSVTALVGPSGSGKSTLAHLIARIWDTDQGAIRLGGVDIREIPLAELHRRVALVLQDVVLFEESILENIRLGCPDAPREQVIQAAKAARAHEFIEALPSGYDTPLGANGAGLSAGQRQRLSIARALMKDAELIILDEATASVDVEEERLIQDAISELTAGKTVIVIAHSLWTIEHVDQILVFEQGRLSEQGNHSSLMAQGGRYRQLWDAQQKTLDWVLPGVESQAAKREGLALISH